MFWILGAAGLVQALSKLGDTPFLRATYEQLDHKDWEGFAFLDLIFPLFVFLAGMSVVFSLGRIAGGDVRAALGVYGDIVLYLVGVTLMLGLARFLYTRKVFVRA
jgi:predicted acyltransferase